MPAAGRDDHDHDDHHHHHSDHDDLLSTAGEPRWWELRRARNLKPATYRCPLCGGHLPSLSDHVLLFPEGDASRRRHAHTACVRSAREAGRLPSRDEWRRSQPRRRWWRRS